MGSLTQMEHYATTCKTSREVIQGKPGAGKYSWNLCASKQLCFNERNCKLGRHNRMRGKVSTLQTTSVHRKAHKICQQVRSIDVLDDVL